MAKETDKMKGLPRKLVEALSGEALQAQEERWAAQERERAADEAGIVPSERKIMGIAVGEPTMMTLHVFQGIENRTFGGGTITENDYAEIIALIILTAQRSYHEVIMPMWQDGIFRENLLVDAVRDLARKLRPIIMGYTMDELAAEVSAYWGKTEKKSEENQ